MNMRMQTTPFADVKIQGQLSELSTQLLPSLHRLKTELVQLHLSLLVNRLTADDQLPAVLLVLLPAAAQTMFAFTFTASSRMCRKCWAFHGTRRQRQARQMIASALEYDSALLFAISSGDDLGVATAVHTANVTKITAVKYHDKAAAVQALAAELPVLSFHSKRLGSAIGTNPSVLGLFMLTSRSKCVAAGGDNVIQNGRGNTNWDSTHPC